MCLRCRLVSLPSFDEPLWLPEITVTQASLAPGRVPIERATAWRSEYSVASVTSLYGTATITMGTSSIWCAGKGLGWYCMPAAFSQRLKWTTKPVPWTLRPRSVTVT